MLRTVNYGFLKIEDDDFFNAQDFADMMDAVDEQLKVQENKTDNASKTAFAKRIDITIPTTGWKNDTDTGGTYALCMDVSVDGITESMIPMLSILPDCQATAKECIFCNTVRTIDGALRVYAQKVPATEIKGSLVLIRITTASGDTGGGTVDADSLLAEIMATDSDVQEVMPEVFGNSETES